MGSNFPIQLTRFVGREQEIGNIKVFLNDTTQNETGSVAEVVGTNWWAFMERWAARKTSRTRRTKS